MGIKRRPRLPIQNGLGGGRRQRQTRLKTFDEPIANGGGFQVDVPGDCAVRCTRCFVERTKLRHDPLVRQLHCLTKMAGVPCAIKIRDPVAVSEARPDLALFLPPGGGEWY